MFVFDVSQAEPARDDAPALPTDVERRFDIHAGRLASTWPCRRQWRVRPDQAPRVTGTKGARARGLT
jgi:hypothetical protein